jgi:hypothetical protein
MAQWFGHEIRTHALTHDHGDTVSDGATVSRGYRVRAYGGVVYDVENDRARPPARRASAHRGAGRARLDVPGRGRFTFPLRYLNTGV